MDEELFAFFFHPWLRPKPASAILNEYGKKTEGSSSGAADTLDQRVINWVTQNVIITLCKEPEANHLKDFYNEAVGTSRK